MADNKLNTQESRTATLSPYDLALLVRYEGSAVDDGAKRLRAAVLSKEGMDTKDTLVALAGASVQCVVELAGESKERRAGLLAAYMTAFADMEMELAGAEVMEEVSRMILEECDKG